ncbi:terminase large subunit domain-containing protein [Meiothermus sp.]|uniref:terminase large subunit domain-containing protein n=1 Tax=Meiothermus sp. TaxID=1955249 RepID=UPI00298F2875|nr:terminase family protein [Meiothermus sp.]
MALLQRVGLEPDPWQERALLSVGNELYILASRQAGKSTVASALALHAAYAWPERTVLLIAPTLRQSSELSAKVRSLATKLGLELAGESALRLELPNRSRVIALPGAQEGIRGYSAHLVVLDEAAWIPDELYQAARPMLAVTGGRLIAISTPYGMRGWFYRAWAEERGERIRVTAYDIPRISCDFLEAERVALGEWAFRQEYLAEFVEAGGAIPEELIAQAVRLEGPEPPQPGRAYAAGLDLARLRDWSSLTVLDVTEVPYRLVHQERWQGEWEYTEARVLGVLRAYGARLTVDATGVGDPVYERLRRAWPQTHPFRFTQASKAQLLTELRLSLAEERLWLYPEPVLLAELRALQARQTAHGVSYEAPSGAHDDTVMSLGLALWTVRGGPTQYTALRVPSRWG